MRVTLTMPNFLRRWLAISRDENVIPSPVDFICPICEGEDMERRRMLEALTESSKYRTVVH